MDDDVLYQILVVLKDSLCRLREEDPDKKSGSRPVGGKPVTANEVAGTNGGSAGRKSRVDMSLVLAIINCLINVIPGIPSRSRFSRSLFWLAMALIQVGDEIALPSVQLLQVILRYLDNHSFFEQEAPETFS